MKSKDHSRVLKELAEGALDLDGRGEVDKLITSGKLGWAERRVLEAIAAQIQKGEIDEDQAYIRYKKLGVTPDEFDSYRN